MKQWGSSPKAFDLRKKLMEGEEVSIVYDKPWFWKLVKSNLPKPVFEKKTHPSKKPVELISSKTTMDDMMKQILEMQKMIAIQQQELNRLKSTQSPVYQPPSPLCSPGGQFPDIEQTFTDMGYDLKKGQSWADDDDDDDDDQPPLLPPKLTRQTAICDDISIDTPTQPLVTGVPNAPKKTSKKKLAKKLQLDVEED